MASYAQVTKDIDIPVIVLPGFQEGVSSRGAWFIHLQEIDSIIRKFSHNRQHVVRYVVYEPSSIAPLSDAEINHIINRYTGDLDRFRTQLEQLELAYSDTRKQGKLNALLYIFGILTIRWYWWIFITSGERSFNNKQNELLGEYANNTKKYLIRFWERGSNKEIKRVLDQIVERYNDLKEEPLTKYMILRDYAAEQAKRAKTRGDKHSFKAYKLIEDGYRSVITKLTDKSMLIKILPSSFWRRIAYFFLRTFNIPLPESILPVRNLNKDIRIQQNEENESINYKNKKIIGTNKVNGNILELYLLATKMKDPICVISKDSYAVLEAISRGETIREKDIPLEVFLHVGTQKEKNILLGHNSDNVVKIEKEHLLHQRIQNATLDVNFQNEAYYGYFNREYISLYYRQYKMAYPFRSRLHNMFPWLFIMHGIPMASALAAVWLFVDPYYSAKQQKNYSAYYSRMIEGSRLGYHNIVIKVMQNPALGFINDKISKNDSGKVYRDIIKDINECALPVDIADRAVLNNLTTETSQLNDFRREANDFTFIPISFLTKDSLSENSEPKSNLMGSGEILNRDM